MQLVAISPKAASFLRSTAERARVSFAERARVFVHENRFFFFFFFFLWRMRGNRNGIYVRDNDTRRRIDRSNSKIRSVSIGSRIELLSIAPMFTVNDTPLSTLSLSPSLSLDRSFVFPMRRHVASVDPRGHTHTTTFRLSFALFPSPPPPRFPSTSLPFPIARRECVLIRPRLLPFGSIRRRGGARWV